jgi:hypothetical protein
MKVCISPGIFGAHFGGSGKWELCIDGVQLDAKRQGAPNIRIPLSSIHAVTLVNGSIWSTIEIVPAIPAATFSGITNREGQKFVKYLSDSVATALARQLSKLEAQIHEIATLATELIDGQSYIASH